MSGWENVSHYNGVSISIAGLLVVFGVLALISGFIAMLPRLMRLLHQVAPEMEHHPVSEAPAAAKAQEEAMVAAVGYAMHLKANRTRTN